MCQNGSAEPRVIGNKEIWMVHRLHKNSRWLDERISCKVYIDKGGMGKDWPTATVKNAVDSQVCALKTNWTKCLSGEKKNEILKLSQYIRLTRMKMTKADYSNIPASVTQFPTGLDDYCNTCTTEEAPLSFKLWYQRDRYVTGRELSRCCHSFTKAVFAIAIDRAHGQNNIRGDGRPLGAIENPAALSH